MDLQHQARACRLSKDATGSSHQDHQTTEVVEVVEAAEAEEAETERQITPQALAQMMENGGASTSRMSKHCSLLTARGPNIASGEIDSRITSDAVAKHGKRCWTLQWGRPQ